MPTPARHVTLSPAEGADEKALTDAAMLLPPVLDGRDVSVGEEFEAAGVKLLVTGTEPLGRVRVKAADTVLDVSARPPSTSRRLVFDALVLVDASWSMGRERDRRFAPFAYVPYAVDALARHAEDVVRAAAIVTFSREGFLEQDFTPVGMLDAKRLDRVVCRGPFHFARALDFGVAALTRRADPRDRHAILVFTDAGKAGDDALEAASRAARVGISVHVVDVGDEPGAGLDEVARRGGGTYVHAPHTASLARAARAMADEVEVPLHWDEPPPDVGDSDVEFEIVLRTMNENDPRTRP